MGLTSFSNLTARTRGRVVAADAVAQRARVAASETRNARRSGPFTCKDSIWEGGFGLELEAGLCFGRGAATDEACPSCRLPGRARPRNRLRGRDDARLARPARRDEPRAEAVRP